MSLSGRTRDEIQALVARFPERRSALLPALKVAQREQGWLPPETIAETADVVGVPHSAALEIAEFYTMLHTEPGPTTRVVVCAQLPCALRGAEQLIRELRSELHDRDTIEVERTSECFGACHRAPMARVDDLYYENLDGEGRKALIAELTRG
ncbi:MAG: NAD(P)H-dependent oxidoreductase subunit E [Chloroflexi bacterium]|nr:NAD(P)H-dependent oxidoreductase subunit E [Chloroflexota bacterium]MBV9894033.1 NAD(P)H-dependent oxidoreductase subunit E [Chloroflexota bacterium]